MRREIEGWHEVTEHKYLVYVLKKNRRDREQVKSLKKKGSIKRDETDVEVEGT